MWQFPEEVKEALAENRYRHFVKITLTDSTVIEVGEDRILQGGLTIDRACSGQSAFEIGSCVIGECKLELNNWDGLYDDYRFLGATIIPRIETWKYDWDGEEVFLSAFILGNFDVVEVDTNGSRVALTCYDNMYKFDIPLTTFMDGQQHAWGYGAFFSGICTAAGVSTSITQTQINQMVAGVAGNPVPIVYEPEQVADLSCRDGLSQMCASLGASAYINDVGELEILQFNDSSWLRATSTSHDYYVNTFAPYFHDFTPANMTKFSRDEDNVTITGITIANKRGEEYSAGTAGYVIDLGENWVIPTSVPGYTNPYQLRFANGLHYMLGDATFRPFKCTHFPEFSMQLGDRILFTDERGHLYKSIVLHMKYTAGEKQETECAAEPASIVNSARYTNAAQAVGKLTAELLPYDDTTTQFGVTNTQDAIEATYAAIGTASSAHEYKAGDTLSTTSGLLCSGTMTGLAYMLAFFVPFSKPCTATSCTCTSLDVLVRTYDGVPYARSGTGGGTYTQLGTSYVTIWENGDTKRSNEVTSISCSPQANGMMVIVEFVYGLAKASGNTATVTLQRPAAVSIQGTFVFS